MQKITFEDTTVVKQPYVTIDNTEYSVHDGTYSGGTDLNASTFNTMQNNIETAINSKISNSTGTSQTIGYSQEYINTELNKKLDNTITQSIISSAAVIKMDKLVVVQGLFVLNDDTATFTTPYKPINGMWIATNGVDNNLNATASNGYISVDTNGDITVKMTSAVTYCTASFCYLTTD